MSALETLKTCFVETFALSPTEDVESLQYQGIQGWDSVGHMALVASIENAFDIMFETQEVLDMNSFARAVTICRAHGVPI